QEKKFSETEAVQIMQSLASGLAALHHEKVLHRNIYPANIFIVQQHFVLGPFKRQSEISPEQQQAYLPYMAPEMLNEQPHYETSSDVFALGVLMHQLCTGSLPWEGLGGIALLKGA